MKVLGPFLFLFAFNAFAGSSTVLQLRAIVPVEYKVQIKVNEEGPVASISSNQKKQTLLPKFEVSKTEDSYLISIVHP